MARDDPLDTYLVTHPEALLDQAVEQTVFDPENPYVLGPHLCAAAQEVPLREGELDLFGPGTRDLLDELTESGRLRRRPQGWYWTHPEPANALTDIRSGGGRPVSLVERSTGRVVGTVDGSSAHATAHAGAVYVHRGETWLVESLDLDDHVAMIDRAEVPSPRPRANSPTSLLWTRSTTGCGARPGSRGARSRSRTKWCPTSGVGSRPAT